MKRTFATSLTVWSAAALLAAMLGGCATQWVVDSKVTSYSRFDALPAVPTYRFERLPSQQAQEASQLELEAMAGPALERAGLRRDDTAPRYSAQIGARVTVQVSPWADPWLYGPWPRWGFGGYGYPYGGHGMGWYGMAYPPAASPWYLREVSIVLRELPGNQIVYETRAFNDGPYSTSSAVLPVMFQAAMQGFPKPPQGARRVDILIPTVQK